jgi:hypothetical protein
MLITVHPAKLEVPASGSGEIVLTVPDPGIVRGIRWVTVPRLVTGPGGAPEFDEDLVAFLEIVPNNPIRKRRLVLLGPTQTVTVPDHYRAEFLDTAVSTLTGRAVHVYELREVGAAAPAGIKSRLVRATS